MKLSRLSVILLAAALSAALLAGCGGASKADYEKDVQKIGAEVEKDLDKLDSGTPDPKSIAAAQESIEQAAKDLEGIDPPSEVSELHDDLVAVLNDTAELMGDLAPLMEQATEDPTSMGEKEMKQMNEITEKFAEIEKEMDRITKAFAKKKYEVGLGDE